MVGLNKRNPEVLRKIARILGDISCSEVEHRRPMLSAVVVNKGAAMPGKGFFKLARKLGRHGDDDDHRFFVRELALVYKHWTS